jgi:glycosyltransferase involved in cell wall biosynthesis
MKSGVLIIHFGDVAGYPPVLHAIPLIAAAGLPVQVLSCLSASDFSPKFPPNFPARLHFCRAMPNGWRKLLHWLVFIVKACNLALWQRPKWVYASDALALPAAQAARFFGASKFLYQEHDSPDAIQGKQPWQRRLVARLRARALKTADIVVMPNEDRLRFARSQVGPGRGEDLVIWNVAPLYELQDKRLDQLGKSLLVHFHGSMGQARVPLALIDAIAKVPNTLFQFASYEFGGRVHTLALLERARLLGIAERVIDLGSIEDREQLLALTRRADVGLAFFSNSPKNINHYYMAGASNKVFDYMSAGLSLLLSNGAQWQAYLPEFGIAVDPNDADSIATALRSWQERHPDARLQGELGRQKIARDWHFEKCYQPLLRVLLSAR